VPDVATDQSKFARLALAVTLVWLAIAGQMLWLDWTQTAQLLGDSDDAMRLVEVRELLAGRGWFDLYEPRLQPPIGYDTHWSRLIDGGLAGLFLLFRSFTDAALAERLMRAVWPLLWLLPAIIGTVALGWRLGGRAAAYVVLLLLLFGLPAFIQFRAGRIDHHDVQITSAILTLATAIYADRVRWTAWAAGALSALALAIGFESMPFVVAAGGLFSLRFISDRDFAPVLSRYGLSLAAATALVFFVSIGPDRWTQTACDAMAINTAAAAAIAGLALSVIGRRFADERLVARAGAIVIAFALAVTVFVLVEPRCLGGPLALVDPAVRPIWLAHVKEVRSLFAAAREDLQSGLAIASYPIVALVAAVVLACDTKLRRDSGFIAAVTALIVAVAMTLVAIRASSYTMWLGVPFVAAALMRVFDRIRLTPLPARVFAIILFTPVSISWCAIAIGGTVSPPKLNQNAEADAACFKIEGYAPLAQLPAGLIVADVDFGPFLLALTPHPVLAAPYHRMSYGIVASHRAFATAPGEAREILRRAQASYVVLCGSRGPKDLPEVEMQRSLWTQLKSGKIPDWLEPMSNTGVFGVYRVKP
jgi:hypothetical protein